MSDTTATLRRILLPVDVSRDSLTALKVAFDLAAALAGEVSGLFIEDAQLLKAGSLPFAREVGSVSGISRRIESADIQDRFRTVATRARTAVTEAGHRLKVPTAFRVGQGDVVAEILEAASTADLVVLGKSGWAPGSLRTPGRTCLTILSQSPVPVLVVEHDGGIAPPIFVAHDESPNGKRAVNFAHNLSRVLKWKIAVFSVLGMSSADDVLRRIREAKPCLVVLPSSLPLKKLASRLPCPVLFVP
jgi:nucleotide-binding universal stress UspA family protein